MGDFSDKGRMMEGRHNNYPPGGGGDLKRGGGFHHHHPSSTRSNTNHLLDMFQRVECFQRPEDIKENLDIFTEKIQRGFASAQVQISERDEELRRLRFENGELLRINHRLESQVVSQQGEIVSLKVSLERERWGDGGEELGVNVTKMRGAVKQLHSAFGAMIDSIRKTNSSVGKVMRGGSGEVEEDVAAMPHDVEELQGEVDHLFTQVKGKLKRWERNQREMQLELGQTREVLGRFMEQLLTARETVSKVRDQAKVVVTKKEHHHHPIPTTTTTVHSNTPPHHHRPIFQSNGVIRSGPSKVPPPQVIFSLPKDNRPPVPAVSASNENKMDLKLPSSPVTEKRLGSSPVPVSTQPVPVHVRSPPSHQVLPVRVSTLDLARILPTPVTPYPCGKCPDVFSTLVQLRLHSKVIHKDQLSSPSHIIPEEADTDNKDLLNINSPQSSKKRKTSSSSEPAETSCLTLTYHQTPPSVIIPSSVYPYHNL